MQLPKRVAAGLVAALAASTVSASRCKPSTKTSLLETATVPVESQTLDTAASYSLPSASGISTITAGSTGSSTIATDMSSSVTEASATETSLVTSAGLTAVSSSTAQTSTTQTSSTTKTSMTKSFSTTKSAISSSTTARDTTSETPITSGSATTSSTSQTSTTSGSTTTGSTTQGSTIATTTTGSSTTTDASSESITVTSSGSTTGTSGSTTTTSGPTTASTTASTTQTTSSSYLTTSTSTTAPACEHTYTDVSISAPFDNSCGNAGWGYAVIGSPFQWDDSGPSNGYTNPGYFGEARPFQYGTVEKIGIDPSQTWYQSFHVYGRGNAVTYTEDGINQQGYMYAAKTGCYTIEVPAADDVTQVWLGSAANSGYTNDNAIIRVTFTTPAVSYTIHLEGGTYVPIRVLNANSGGPFRFTVTIRGPDGSVLADLNSAPQVVNYVCDIDSSVFPSWGNNEPQYPPNNGDGDGD